MYGCSYVDSSTHSTSTSAPDSFLHSSPVTYWSIQDQLATSSSYDALPQVLIHLARDWGEYGVGIRNKLYIDGIIHELMAELPLGDSDGHSSDLRVLVPGAGLGRLAVEIAARGYRYVCV